MMRMQIMLNIGRGQHGSTYGGNPVAARVAVAALKVLVDEQLALNSDRMGKMLRSQLQAIPSHRIAEVRYVQRYVRVLACPCLYVCLRACELTIRVHLGGLQGI